MRNTPDVTCGKPIAVFLQSISGVIAINPLVAFYDIHGQKRDAILLFCPGHHTRQLLILVIRLNSLFSTKISLKLRETIVVDQKTVKQTNDPARRTKNVNEKPFSTGTHLRSNRSQFEIR
jgi:hypothetical protein